MARLFLHDNLKTIPTEDLRTYLEELFATLQDQWNEGVQVAALNDLKRNLPVGMQGGDVIFDYQRGELRVGIYNGVDVAYTSFGSFTGAITDAQHGPRAGGNLHEPATTTVAGFMSAADKIMLSRFKGNTVTTAPASLTEYPTAGDWGFHNDTTGGTFSLVNNFAGTLKSVPMT